MANTYEVSIDSMDGIAAGFINEKGKGTWLSMQVSRGAWTSLGKPIRLKVTIENADAE